MTKLSVTHDFVRKLTREIREVYGKDVQHTKVLEMVAKSLGWRTDALMHMLKHQPEQHTKKKEEQPRFKIIDISQSRPLVHFDKAQSLTKIESRIDKAEEKGFGRIEQMKAAMRNAMRRNPDAIVIGECTDPESVEVVRAAREAGFLVWSTFESRCLGEGR